MTRYREHLAVLHKIQQPDAVQTIILLVLLVPMVCVAAALIGVAMFFIHHYAR